MKRKLWICNMVFFLSLLKWDGSRGLAKYNICRVCLNSASANWFIFWLQWYPSSEQKIFEILRSDCTVCGRIQTWNSWSLAQNPPSPILAGIGTSWAVRKLNAPSKSNLAFWCKDPGVHVCITCSCAWKSDMFFFFFVPTPECAYILSSSMLLPHSTHTKGKICIFSLSTKACVTTDKETPQHFAGCFQTNQRVARNKWVLPLGS